MLLLPFILLLLPFVFVGCEKEDDGDETKISRFSSSESHKNGENCMDCHAEGGSGEGWFTVAGSVYDSTLANPYAGAAIKISSGPQNAGSLLATIEVDKNGNFYTTESIPFGDVMYVSVTGKTGSVKFMNSSIDNGQCNGCHVNTSKISIK